MNGYDYEAFKKHPLAYQGITKESLLDELSAPLHKTAESIYKSRALLP